MVSRTLSFRYLILSRTKINILNKFQVAIIRLLRDLGKGDQEASDAMNDSLAQV